ncbi:hypothetical protein FZ103_10055 [Streptomonospora sp. PA3]|uniref:hypothetical protein n=1 Tax=Streptomonospora sp. PA3 TaxID=2607326 RepID=UPI0012DDDF7C|nr:hypothetical protein [Streptomonospora sp. PA3]MUL41514.1 hypothetical protein [Streptomonospora sp. PA3]
MRIAVSVVAEPNEIFARRRAAEGVLELVGYTIDHDLPQLRLMPPRGPFGSTMEAPSESPRARDVRIENFSVGLLGVNDEPSTSLSLMTMRDAIRAHIAYIEALPGAVFDDSIAT